jgi:hypothetical protein
VKVSVVKIHAPLGGPAMDESNGIDTAASPGRSPGIIIQLELSVVNITVYNGRSDGFGR